jgi:hypothetical protein
MKNLNMDILCAETLSWKKEFLAKVNISEERESAFKKSHLVLSDENDESSATLLVLDVAT